MRNPNFPAWQRVDNPIGMLNLAYLGCTATAFLEVVLIIYSWNIKEI